MTTAWCPQCQKPVRVGIPRGGDGSANVYYRHRDAAGLPCPYSRLRVDEAPCDWCNEAAPLCEWTPERGEVEDLCPRCYRAAEDAMRVDPDLHHHYLSAGGQTLTHTHPGGRRLHDGKMSPHHRGHDRGAYFNHPGPAPSGLA